PAAGLPKVSPDAAERDLDNIVPSRGYEMPPMIGLGGSAGGIAALQRFFSKMPADSGLTFVVILHLSPEHESTLAELLQRCTAMPVVQAQGNEKAEANCVYVIPPGKHLSAVDGHLRLSDLEPKHGKRVAVDLFFRTLADTHGPHAAAIVLSGADSDGAIGIKRIKERGGLTIAQDPNEAEHASMPRSSIATGMVDWVLPVEEMPARIIEYHMQARRLVLPPEEGPPPGEQPPLALPEAEAALREILTFLRTRTGRDFSYYKRATILRRIARRLQVNGLEALPGYMAFLRTHPGEAGALLQDLLISVTNFFRDREAFDSLAERIPKLFAGKGPNDTVRVWVPACATGEEAYSIAMLLSEHARTLDAPPVLQVFATDLDDAVVQFARTGLYQETITADVSEERLQRFFVKEHRGYRVRRELREIVLFAIHDLLKDAPFSRLDLVSCRNLLIYLNREAQTRALEIFYFALRPGALLFLGSSEFVDEASPLFGVVDKKHRLYVQRGIGRVPLPVLAGPGAPAFAFTAPGHPRGAPVMPGLAFQQKTLEHAALHARSHGEERGEAGWNELHLKLIEHFVPPSLIVNEAHEILHLSANVGRFLHFSGGEPTMNLMRVIHPMLRIELRAALFRASQGDASAEALRVPVEIDGIVSLVDIRVVAAPELAPGFFLVTLQSSQAGELAPVRGEPEPVARELERELEGVKSNLRDTVEQYEASTEELKASNEELQAMNEELRSATEELETGREELQSINEELTTVNTELKSKVDELGHANSDLHNLMASTAIATIFLDRGLRIMRFTPSAVPLFNIIATDIGRPLSDLTHQLDYPELKQDALRVLERLVPIERVVEHGQSRSYLSRMLPYRTTEDRIGGVVLTFVDITERLKTEKALRDREQQLSLVIETAPASILCLDADERVRFANRLFLKRIGRTEEQAIGRTSQEVLGQEEYRQIAPCLQKAFAGEEAECEFTLKKPDGSITNLHFRYAPALGAGRQVLGVVAVGSDVTEQKAATGQLEANRQELLAALQATEQARAEAEAAGQAKDQFLAVLSHELRTPLTPVLMAVHTLSRRKDLPEAVTDALAMIRRNVEMEAHFIDDLLDLTRITRGKIEIALDSMDLHEAVHRAVEVSATDFETKQQTLSVTLEATEHRIAGDVTRLPQALWNLLKNASKFTPEHGEIMLRTRNEPGVIIVEVIDSGIGIDPVEIEKIFHPFEQANRGIAQQYGGLGLGLAIARATLEAHGGKLEGASAGLGHGTTFTVTLPLHTGPPSELPRPNAPRST
ncbi:MAG TPA: chemotaxis protein CheB, partial [Chthoniobacteraceae bacterium]|nr:chemotaxis protein CheB [Chthoniobacteraceae bacterium]